MCTYIHSNKKAAKKPDTELLVHIQGVFGRPLRAANLLNLVEALPNSNKREVILC